MTDVQSTVLYITRETARRATREAFWLGVSIGAGLMVLVFLVIAFLAGR